MPRLTQSARADAGGAVMRALGDPTRRALYERLARGGEASVMEITRSAGVSQPAVSQHLKALRAAGLVTERRAGRNSYYSPNPAGLAPLVDWLDYYTAFWRDRMTALRTLLKEIDPQ